MKAIAYARVVGPLDTREPHTQLPVLYTTGLFDTDTISAHDAISNAAKKWQHIFRKRMKLDDPGLDTFHHPDNWEVFCEYETHERVNYDRVFLMRNKLESEDVWSTNHFATAWYLTRKESSSWTP